MIIKKNLKKMLSLVFKYCYAQVLEPGVGGI